MKKGMTVSEHISRIQKKRHRKLKLDLGKEAYSLMMSDIAKRGQERLKLELGPEGYSDRMSKMGRANRK